MICDGPFSVQYGWIQDPVHNRQATFRAEAIFYRADYQIGSSALQEFPCSAIVKDLLVSEFNPSFWKGKFQVTRNKNAVVRWQLRGMTIDCLGASLNLEGRHSRFLYLSSVVLIAASVRRDGCRAYRWHPGLKKMKAMRSNWNLPINKQSGRCDVAKK